MVRKLILSFLMALPLVASAQRLGYVDTQKILEAIPDYQQAQTEIERLSKQWEGEILSMIDDATALQAQLDAESVLLTPDMVSERQGQIDAIRDSANTLQQHYFGPEGLLFTKRAELVAPIQALVAGAIKEVARKRKLDFVFDKGSNIAVVYAKPAHDYSDEVLQQLGY